MQYGPHPDQRVEVCAPSDAPRAIAVVIHGGFWRARYKADLMNALCRDLAARGYEAWNAEYRRVGDGGGWPATLDDVAAVVGRAGERGLPVVTLGHSAGGHLALWAAAPGVALAVAQAGVVDLAEAWRLGLSSHAVGELLGGGPAEVPDRYAEASPAARIPLGIRQLIVHGRNDDVVPIEMSRSYRDRASAAGDEIELVETDEGHFECLDPGASSWAAIVQRLP